MRKQNKKKIKKKKKEPKKKGIQNIETTMENARQRHSKILEEGKYAKKKKNDNPFSKISLRNPSLQKSEDIYSFKNHRD